MSKVYFHTSLVFSWKVSVLEKMRPIETSFWRFLSSSFFIFKNKKKKDKKRSVMVSCCTSFTIKVVSSLFVVEKELQKSEKKNYKLEVVSNDCDQQFCKTRVQFAC